MKILTSIVAELTPTKGEGMKVHLELLMKVDMGPGVKLGTLIFSSF